MDEGLIASEDIIGRQADAEGSYSQPVLSFQSNSAKALPRQLFTFVECKLTYLVLALSTDPPHRIEYARISYFSSAISSQSSLKLRLSMKPLLPL